MQIDASQSGQVRLALAWPEAGGTARLDRVLCYDAAKLPTFTDALMRFEAESRIDLRRFDAVLAVAGAVAGHAIPIVRSRWIVSRAGLAALFRRPPTIINDVAARPWALRDRSAPIRAVRGPGRPDLTRPSRYLLVMLGEGVGCAQIDIGQQGTIRIMDSEAGHVDFSPADAAEAKIAAVVAGDSAPASWEQMLMLKRCDPRLTSEGAASDVQRGRMLATMLGRFTVNVVLASGAWDGAILTGSGAGRILAGDDGVAFDATFQHRRVFRRMIAALPCWMVNQPDPVMTGLAALIADRERATTR